MEDWRLPQLKFLTRLFWALIVILAIWIILMKLVADSLKQADANFTFGVIGLMLTVVIIDLTAIFDTRQEIVATRLSIVESDLDKERIKQDIKIKHMEESIEKFYSPLFNLLSTGSLDIVKLHDINYHRYLAKKQTLCYFEPFYKDCVDTKQLHVSMTRTLLQIVDSEIDGLNNELKAEYNTILTT